jgi:magnesium-transporting ATPase (P-type)
MPDSTTPPPAWHALPAEQTFQELKSSDDGLSAAEARTRLLAHGPNRIERGSRRSALKILRHQLADPLVYVLIAAGLIAALMGKITDGVVVLAVVVINTWSVSCRRCARARPSRP